MYNNGQHHGGRQCLSDSGYNKLWQQQYLLKPASHGYVGLHRHGPVDIHGIRRNTKRERIHTDQSCVATMKDKKLTITSKLERVTKVEPFWLAMGMEKRYAPDNFMVTINPAGDEMTGLFESMGEAPVTFRRQQELVS